MNVKVPGQCHQTPSSNTKARVEKQKKRHRGGPVTVREVAKKTANRSDTIHFKVGGGERTDICAKLKGKVNLGNPGVKIQGFRDIAEEDAIIVKLRKGVGDRKGFKQALVHWFSEWP